MHTRFPSVVDDVGDEREEPVGALARLIDSMRIVAMSDLALAHRPRVRELLRPVHHAGEVERQLGVVEHLRERQVLHGGDEGRRHAGVLAEHRLERRETLARSTSERDRRVDLPFGGNVHAGDATSGHARIDNLRQVRESVRHQALGFAPYADAAGARTRSRS